MHLSLLNYSNRDDVKYDRGTDNVMRAQCPIGRHTTSRNAL